MVQFNLSQLLLGFALVAIASLIPQTEGCGSRYTQIESVAFSPDESQLLVSRLDARDSRTPMKFYKADVSRTVSVIDLSDGSTSAILDQQLKSGNQGAAFGLWWHSRTSVDFVADGSVVIQAFGGGTIDCLSLNGEQPPRQLKSLNHTSTNLAGAATANLIVASDSDQVSIIDPIADAAVHRIAVQGCPFLHASRFSFSTAHGLIALGTYDGVYIWDYGDPANTLKTIVAADDNLIHGVYFLPDESLVVLSDQWLRRYDNDGNIIRTLPEPSDYSVCSVSSDGSLIASTTYDQISIHE